MIDDLACAAKCGFDSVKINAIINGKINAKRLQFNKNKCVKLHISPNMNRKCCKTQLGDTDQKIVSCVQLEVQDTDMKQSNTEKYIGDVISADGSNDENIKKRRSQGIGAMAQIFSILSEISLGYHYVEIGLILRESILLSKLLLSCESWYKLHKYQIEKLEEIDNSFFHRLFNSHSKTSKEIYLIESGKIPIRIIISMRRIMYWWHILHAKQTDMLVKVYNVQKVSHVQGDWIRLLEQDKKMFKINLSDEEVSGMSRYKIKNVVKKRGQELTLNYIEGLKKKHSKTEHFETSTLKTAQYLTDNSFTKSQRELLFKLRSKTVQVKANFRNGNILNMVCEICQLFTCTQEHVLQSPVYHCEHSKFETQFHLWQCRTAVTVHTNLHSILGSKAIDIGIAETELTEQCKQN